jgi:hypothetical protein
MVITRVKDGSREVELDVVTSLGAKKEAKAAFRITTSSTQLISVLHLTRQLTGLEEFLCMEYLHFLLTKLKIKIFIMIFHFANQI